MDVSPLGPRCCFSDYFTTSFPTIPLLSHSFLVYLIRFSSKVNDYVALPFLYLHWVHLQYWGPKNCQNKGDIHISQDICPDHYFYANCCVEIKGLEKTIRWMQILWFNSENRPCNKGVRQIRFRFFNLLVYNVNSSLCSCPAPRAPISQYLDFKFIYYIYYHCCRSLDMNY